MDGTIKNVGDSLNARALKKIENNKKIKTWKICLLNSNSYNDEEKKKKQNVGGGI